MASNIIKQIKNNYIYLLALLLLTFTFFIGFYNYKVPAHDVATFYYPNAEALKISLFEYKE